jgi:hypothetical protein
MNGRDLLGVGFFRGADGVAGHWIGKADVEG